MKLLIALFLAVPASAQTMRFEGGAVTAADLVDGSIQTAKLDTDSVTASKIIAQGVTTPKIADLAVETGKIGTDAITAAKISATAVTAAKLADVSVETRAIGTDAVTAAKIQAVAVQTAKLAADSVTNVKILAGSIDSNKLTSGMAIPGGVKSPFSVEDSTFSIVGGIVTALSQPAAGVRVTASQQIGNNSEQVVGFGSSIDFVRGNMYVNAIDTEKIKVPVGGAGLYDIKAAVYVPAAASGRVIINIKKNGSTYLPYCQIAFNSGVAQIAECHRTVDLAASDYLTLSVNQNSGANIDIFSSANVTTIMEVVKKW